MNYNNLTISQMKNQSQKTINWFSKGAMIFFNTEIESKAHLNFFITSDRYDYNSPKIYSIRYYNNHTKSVETVGNFQQFETLEDAKKAMNNLGLLFEAIRLSGGYLENSILKRFTYSNYNNGLYELTAVIENEYKTLKLNAENVSSMTFTF